MAKENFHSVRIRDRYHEYLSRKIKENGKIYRLIENLIQADMERPENKKFLSEKLNG